MKRFDQGDVNNPTFLIGRFNNEFFQKIELVDLLQPRRGYLAFLCVLVIDKFAVVRVLKDEFGYFSDDVEPFLQDDVDLRHVH
jgi:hypothetical protein